MPFGDDITGFYFFGIRAGYPLQFLALHSSGCGIFIAIPNTKDISCIKNSIRTTENLFIISITFHLIYGSDHFFSVFYGV